MVRPLTGSSRQAADAVARKQHLDHRVDNLAAATVSVVAVSFNKILARQRPQHQCSGDIEIDGRANGRGLRGWRFSRNGMHNPWMSGIDEQAH